MEYLIIIHFLKPEFLKEFNETLLKHSELVHPICTLLLAYLHLYITCAYGNNIINTWFVYYIFIIKCFSKKEANHACQFYLTSGIRPHGF